MKGVGVSRWSNYLKRAVQSSESSVYASMDGDFQSVLDARYCMARHVAQWIIEAYRDSPQLSVLRVKVAPVAQKLSKDDAFIDFDVGGEFVFDFDGQKRSVPIDYDVPAAVFNAHHEAGVELRRWFKNFLERFAEDMAMNDSPFNKREINTELFGGAVNLEIERVDYEACMIDGRADVGLMVDTLYEGEMVLMPGYESMPSVSIEDHSVDFSQPRPVWDAYSVGRIAKHLRAGMPPDALDLRGVPPLMVAVSSMNFEAFEALVSAGADVNATSMAGMDLIGCALLFSDIEMLKSVVQRAGLKEGASHLPNLLIAAYNAVHEGPNGVDKFRYLVEAGMNLSTRMPNGSTLEQAWDEFGLDEGPAKAFLSSYLARADLMGAFGEQFEQSRVMSSEKKSVSLNL